MKKTLITILVTVLVCGSVFGTTLALLMDSTDPITNTFTVGDISIELKETTTDYKMVPGNEIAKDPKVTVSTDSEDCWLFVKIEETNNPTNYLDYTIASGWTALEGKTGVYYRQVTDLSNEKGVALSVLTGDKVTVKSTLTKDALATAKTAQPQLTFTAYAVQMDNVATAAAAWANFES